MYTEQYLDQRLHPLQITRTGTYAFWSNPCEFSCNKCSHTWITTPRRIIIDGTRCPQCAGNLKGDTKSFVLKAVKQHGTKYDYSSVMYVKSNEPVTIRCPDHGSFNQTPNSHLTGYGCIACANNTLNSNAQFELKLNQANRGVVRIGEYTGSHNAILVQCQACNHEWTAKPTKLTGKAATGCPKCRTKYGVFGTFVEAHGKTFRSILESKCYDVVQKFCSHQGFEFEYQKKYIQSTTNHSCDFYIVDQKLWIEVSCINTPTYHSRIQRKLNWIRELGENFLFVTSDTSLRNILYGKI